MPMLQEGREEVQWLSVYSLCVSPSWRLSTEAEQDWHEGGDKNAKMCGVIPGRELFAASNQGSLQIRKTTLWGAAEGVEQLPGAVKDRRERGKDWKPASERERHFDLAIALESRGHG